jgi:hypothetical protein
MRREWTWLLAITVAFLLGSICGTGYARLATPYYTAVTQAIAAWYPWRIVEVTVTQDDANHTTILRLTGEVRRSRAARRPAARVVSRVQVGEVIETPLVFWTLVLLWPARTARQRVWRVAAGFPIFLVLEDVTTGCQLVHPLAEASALLAGEQDPTTVWEHWSRFLEAGGRFGLEVAAALFVVGLNSSLLTTPKPADPVAA